jgi:hypothetical protein
MKRTRATCGIVMIAITILATVGQAADLEIITPALISAPFSGLGYICLVTNVSDRPVNIQVEELDDRGNFLGGFTTRGLPPLWTSSIGPGSPVAPGSHKCRVTSDDGQKGDLRVTFCTVAPTGGCQAAVTAE